MPKLGNKSKQSLLRRRLSGKLPKSQPSSAVDPTRTVTLRLTAIRAVRRKFAKLRGLLVKLVVSEDAFGLAERKPYLMNSFCPTGVGGGVDPACSPGTSVGEYSIPRGTEFKNVGKDDHGRTILVPVINVENCNPGQMRGVKGECGPGIGKSVPRDQMQFPKSQFVANRFQFHSSPDKVLEFQKWLRQQFKSVLLGKSDEKLWAEFARRGYEKGAGRAFDDVNKKRRWLPGEGEFYGKSKQQFLKSSFGRPESVDKLKLLASRSFDDLTNVTEDMATRMSRTLMDGLSRGANPRDLVKSLVADLDVSATRAETIARTEIIRAHSEGQLDSFEKLGVEEVGVAVEWDTAKDGRVCRHCRPLQGVVLTVQEAHGMIPAHPSCRCAFIPANVGEDIGKQKRTKTEILDAFEEAETEPPELDDQRPEPLVEPTKNELHEFSRLLWNAFCPTGPGGGVDPTCTPGKESLNNLVKDIALALRPIRNQITRISLYDHAWDFVVRNHA